MLLESHIRLALSCRLFLVLVSEQFNIGQGVAQGCSMSPILFSIFINPLLDEVGEGWDWHYC